MNLLFIKNKDNKIIHVVNFECEEDLDYAEYLFESSKNYLLNDSKYGFFTLLDQQRINYELEDYKTVRGNY